MHELGRDLRHTLRSLGRAPLFTTVAVVTLALAIGVGATLFGFVDAALLRPLPVEHPEELVSLFTTWESEGYATSSRPDYLDLAAGVRSAQLIGHATALAVLQQGGGSRMVIGELVTGNAFSVLGVEPALGRMITPADDTGPGAPRAVVLGNGFWRRAMGGDRGVVGKSLRLNGYQYEIVGVAPAGFRGLMPAMVADFWVPSVRVDEVSAAGQITSVTGDTAASLHQRRGYRFLWIKGRLQPGTAADRPGAEAAAVMLRLAHDYPLTNDGKRAIVTAPGDVRLHPDLDKILAAASAVLLGAVGLLVLVVCANLANMVLSRALARQRDLAIRLALGSSRLRLLRQLVLESLLLAVGGVALGLLLARWATAALLHALPPLPFEVGLAVGIDGRVALFAALLGTLAAVLCGLLPARRLLQRELVADLREGARSSEGKARAWSLRNLLVVSQVGVSMVLLVCGALLGRSLLAARKTDVGIAPQRVGAIGVDLSMQGYTAERAAAYLQSLRERAAAMPGVEAASIATRVPFDLNVNYAELYPDTASIPAGKPGIGTDITAADPGYLEAIGVKLLAGRAIDSRDAAGTPGVAMVNEAMARRYWGSPAAAIGRSFRNGKPDAPPTTVIGVFADHKVRSVGEEPRPFVAFALAQQPSRYAYLLARSRSADAAALVQPLRRLAVELDPDAAVIQATTLAGFAAISLYPVRMGASLLGAFALLALALASVGLYGVVAFSVARRQREMGIRLAVGADRAELVRLVVLRGMRLVAVGVVLGGVLAALATRLLGGVLQGVGALDPLSFALAATVLGLAGWAANVVPARRAAATDPVVVLRGE